MDHTTQSSNVQSTTLANCTAWPAASLLLGLSLVIVGSQASLYAAETRADQGNKLIAILGGAAPSSVDELRAMQDHVRSLTQRVAPATVAVQVGTAQGSGVIVTPDGFVLTAAHVMGHAEQRAFVYLRDGRRVEATKLGTCRTLDAGLLKLHAPSGPTKSWPHVEMGDSSTVTLGQWCLAMGHPGGIQAAPEPAVRLGRILKINQESSTMSSDCTLIGGDSGGPLFNMRGHVVGIHSRIGNPLTANLHVPINDFRDVWQRLEKGDHWGHTPGIQPFIGVEGEFDSKDAKISRVFRNSAAEKAGIREGDVIVRFAGNAISDFESLRRYVEEQEPDTKAEVVVLRGGKQVRLEIVVGRIRE